VSVADHTPDADEITPFAEEQSSYYEEAPSYVADYIPDAASEEISVEFMHAQAEAKRAVERYKKLQRKKEEEDMSSFDV
jgi:hypothetical protein